MSIEFNVYRENRSFVVFKSDNFDEVGDHSEVHLRKDSKVSDIENWVFIPLKEYEDLLYKIDNPE